MAQNKSTTTKRKSSAASPTRTKKTAARTTPNPKSKKRTEEEQNVYNTVCSLLYVLIGIFFFLSMFGILGPVGNWLRDVACGGLGACSLGIPLLFLYMSILKMTSQQKPRRHKILLAAGLLWCIAAFYTVCRMNLPEYQAPFSDYFQDLTVQLIQTGISWTSGGILGGYLAYPLMALCAKLGAGIILFILIIVLIVLISGISFASMFRETPEKEDTEELPTSEENAHRFPPIPKSRTKKMEKEIAGLKKQVEELKRSHDFKIPEITEEELLTPAERRRKKTEKKSPPISATEIVPENLFSEELFQNPEKTPDKPLLSEETKEELLEEIANEVRKSEENESEEQPYIYPPLSLLVYKPDENEAMAMEERRQTASKLMEALHSFSVDTRILDIVRGPTITRYELQPSAGVKISKITNLADDIALHLAASGVRIEAPIPGKSAIGIEIPNKVTSVVYLKETLSSDAFRNGKSNISVALGKDIGGENVVIDLAKMPHLLIAGATGSGKSVCINSILMSILYKASPEDVKLILVDPKVVELSVYNGIPHLLIPVVTSPNKAAGALAWAVTEMLNRYKLFAEKSVRNFQAYNQQITEDEIKLPQIVIIIDELADLMMAAPGEVEDAICRLAQMARAAGMHLVIATQRPSADVITGIIKANVPSRIAFAVSSQIDSRIILDQSGAEKLIGRGDMLYNPLGAPKPIRVQGCFVSDKEVEDVISFIKDNYEVHSYDEGILQKIEQLAQDQQKSGTKATAEEDNDTEDELLPRAIEIVVECGQASTSMLQRRLGVGHSRAGRLMDQMEKRGIVGPYMGSKPRDVLMTKLQLLEMKATENDHE